MSLVATAALRRIDKLWRGAYEPRSSQALVEQLKRKGGRQPETNRLSRSYESNAGLDDGERAFPWLERAHEERRQRLTWLNVDPL